MKTITALVLAIVSASIQVFAAEAPRQATTGGAPSAIAQSDVWWTGFDEPLLVPLQRLARARLHATGDRSQQGVVDTQIALVLIEIRTLQARLGLLNNIRGVLSRQRELALAEGPGVEGGRTVSDIDARLSEADRIRFAFVAQDESLIAVMATLTGSSADTARSFANGADAGRSAVAIPTYEPASALTTIFLATEDPVVALSASADDSLVEIDRRRTEAAIMGHRWNAGLIGEREVLAAYERLLVEEDAFVVVRAQLACAWIDAHARLGSGSLMPNQPASTGLRESVGSSR